MNHSENIHYALKDYQQAFQDWSEDKTNAEKVLHLLHCRDILHRRLTTAETAPNAKVLNEICQLDRSLRKQRHDICKSVELPEFRQSLHPSPDQWWWSLDEIESIHHLDQYDWLFDGIGLGAWTASLALLVDICRRFLLGGAGVAGLSVVTLSSILTLLKARSDLTVAGQKSFDLLLEKLKIPTIWRSEVKCASTVSLASSLLVFYLLLPSISVRYSDRGVAAQAENKLATAENNYQRAIALNPENIKAHYNLGTLYEDMRKFDLAISHYSIAINDNFPEAYNNLARLYIHEYEEELLEEAVYLLQRGLTITAPSDGATLYALSKNLGWARLKQGYFKESENLLKKAIVLGNGSVFWSEKTLTTSLVQTSSSNNVYSLAASYCLLAQALEKQNSPQTTEAWQYCCQEADSSKIGEDTWLFQAQTYLKNNISNYNSEDLSCRSTQP